MDSKWIALLVLLAGVVMMGAAVPRQSPKLWGFGGAIIFVAVIAFLVLTFRSL